MYSRLTFEGTCSPVVVSNVICLPPPLNRFCHGAPGIILCLTLIDRLYPSDQTTRLSEYEEKHAKCVWERGLLTKSVGLCHGESRH